VVKDVDAEAHDRPPEVREVIARAAEEVEVDSGDGQRDVIDPPRVLALPDPLEYEGHIRVDLDLHARENRSLHDAAHHPALRRVVEDLGNTAFPRPAGDAHGYTGR
jgi:hypothetical protein